MIAAFEEAGARMSNHSLDTEEGRYAGQAHIAGIEGPDRDVYKKISDAFNKKVFGAEFGYKLEVPSTSLLSLSADSAMASTAPQVSITTTRIVVTIINQCPQPSLSS